MHLSISLMTSQTMKKVQLISLENTIPWRDNTPMKTPSGTCSVSLHRNLRSPFLHMSKSVPGALNFKEKSITRSGQLWLLLLLQPIWRETTLLVSQMCWTDFWNTQKKKRAIRGGEKKPWTCRVAAVHSTELLFPHQIVSHLKGQLQNLMRCV